MTVALAASMTFSACDLPTTADEAREHLGRNQQERIIPVHLPLPEISVTLADQLAALSGIVDTTDLSFRVDPDTFAFALDSLLALEPVDPPAVVQGYDLVIDDFARDISVALPAVPVALPGTDPVQFPLPPFPASGSETIAVDLSEAFTTATFATGSAFQVILTTDEAATVTDIMATIEDDAGNELSASQTTSLAASTTDTLSIPLAGLELPSSFNLVVSFASGTGDMTDDNLTMSTEFANAQVTSARGVDAASVSPVTFSKTVALDVAGSDFSEATLAGGTVSVTSFSSGSLVFEPTFDGDLTGMQVGGASADDLAVSGTVSAPAGASTVDITNSADLTIAFRNLEVASVTLNRVTMPLDQAVTVEAGGTLDNLAEVTIESGTLQVAVTNRLDVGGDVTLTLNGITDGSGVISQTFALKPSPDGEPVTTTVDVDLAGTVLDPAALEAVVAGTISGTDVVVTPERAADAVTVDPYLEIQPRQVVLAGVPDMAVELDERVAIATDAIDLGELGDLLDKITFNDVTFTVTVENATGLDVQVDSFRMTLLDATGAPVLVGSDTARVVLSNDASGSVSAPANTATVVESDAKLFVNALLERVAAGEDVEVAATGSVGPAADSGTISLGDMISVIFEIQLGSDISIDPTGISFDQVVHEALELDSIAAEFMTDLSQDLVSASVEFEAVNAMPFGFTIAMALAPAAGDTTGFDPFAAPRKIELPAFTIAAAKVDAEGRVTAPTVSSPEATVDPARFDVLSEGSLSMGLSATITGPEGNRAQLQPSDSLVLRPLLKIEIRVGGKGGTQ